MSSRSDPTPWKTATACSLAALGLMLLPPRVTDRVRSVARDALLPGQLLVAELDLRWRAVEPEVLTPAPSDDTLQRRVEELELELRRQRVRQAQLHEDLALARRHGTLPYEPASTSPLIVHDLVTARVLGREDDLRDIAGLMIQAGATTGIRADAFVVETNHPVLDIGTRTDIQAGQPVYCGRCVMGRIARSGRWTSTVQLVTHPDYSGRAQLVRGTTKGQHFGAEGILSGRGDGTCSLTGIPYTEPVAVGDDVYTGGRSARFPHPMYYGRVTHAELQAGARWNIVVTPQVDPSRVREVGVLRESLDSTRVLGQ